MVGTHVRRTRSRSFFMCIVLGTWVDTYSIGIEMYLKPGGGFISIIAEGSSPVGKKVY